MSTIPSVSNKDENGIAGWEKSVVDVKILTRVSVTPAIWDIPALIMPG